jgi:DNA-binding NarL/FixJ family response regulator
MGARSYVLLSYPRRAEDSKLGLTPSEHAVARALLAGFSNADIGRLRGSSTRTIANQVASIFRKLGVRSRAELAARWSSVLLPSAK